MKRRAKLKDIAAVMNVSIATVSRALNDKYDINEATKIEAIRIAEELNYRPNVMAASLRKNTFNIVGVILPSIDHYFFSTLLKGVMNKSHKANYLVLVGETNHDPKKETTIMEQFVNNGVTGVIISPAKSSGSAEIFARFRKKRIPFVLVDRPLIDDLDSFVKYDDPKGAFLAVEHLVQQGYKNIGCIKAIEDCIISRARFTGYKKALEHYDLAVNYDHIENSNNTDIPDGYNLGKKLLHMRNRPDAIFTVCDDLAVGVYKAAKDMSLKIPEDLGVVGYSNSKLSQYITPQLSTVEQPGIEMGEEAFDFLQQILLGSTEIFKKTFEAKLIIRGSSTRNHFSINEE